MTTRCTTYGTKPGSRANGVCPNSSDRGAWERNALSCMIGVSLLDRAASASTVGPRGRELGPDLDALSMGCFIPKSPNYIKTLAARTWVRSVAAKVSRRVFDALGAPIHGPRRRRRR